jgi:hypothetical protein
MSTCHSRRIRQLVTYDPIDALRALTLLPLPQPIRLICMPAALDALLDETLDMICGFMIPGDQIDASGRESTETHSDMPTIEQL